MVLFSKRIAQAGHKKVESFGYSKANGFWGLSAQQFKELLYKNGLTAASAHYSFDKYFETGNTGDLNDHWCCKNTSATIVVLPYVGDAFRKTATDLKDLVGKINIAEQ